LDDGASLSGSRISPVRAGGDGWVEPKPRRTGADSKNFAGTLRAVVPVGTEYRAIANVDGKIDDAH
jgi:hypothetical protein